MVTFTVSVWVRTLGFRLMTTLCPFTSTLVFLGAYCGVINRRFNTMRPKYMYFSLTQSANYRNLGGGTHCFSALISSDL